MQEIRVNVIFKEASLEERLESGNEITRPLDMITYWACAKSYKLMTAYKE